MSLLLSSIWGKRENENGPARNGWSKQSKGPEEVLHRKAELSED